MSQLCKFGMKALVVGGGLVGMETAAFMAERNAEVTLVEQLPKSPVTKATSHGYSIHKYLRDNSCVLRFVCGLKRIGANSVTITSEEKEEELTRFDQVVIAVGIRSKNDLKQFLEDNGINHTVVGDALQGGRAEITARSGGY